MVGIADWLDKGENHRQITGAVVMIVASRGAFGLAYAPKVYRSLFGMGYKAHPPRMRDGVLFLDSSEKIGHKVAQKMGGVGSKTIRATKGAGSAVGGASIAGEQLKNAALEQISGWGDPGAMFEDLTREAMNIREDEAKEKINKEMTQKDIQDIQKALAEKLQEFKRAWDLSQNPLMWLTDEEKRWYHVFDFILGGGANDSPEPPTDTPTTGGETPERPSPD